MPNRITLQLTDAQSGYQAIQHAWRFAKPLLLAQHRLQLEIRPQTRRDNDNRHFHSLIGQISAQLGKTIPQLADPDDAKRVLISAFRIDTRDDNDLAGAWASVGDLRMGQGLRGEVVLMGIQSRDFTIKLARAFICWLEAFGAEHDVRFTAPEGWQ